MTSCETCKHAKITHGEQIIKMDGMTIRAGGKGMEYTMRLTAAPFEKLRNGSKVIELRLYDEKRKRIKTGDTILFISLKNPSDTLLTQVTDIYTFASFEDLYRALPLDDLGYSAEDVAAASPKDMEEFYSPEEQAQYGVVGFRLDLIPQPQGKAVQG